MIKMPDEFEKLSVIYARRCRILITVNLAIITLFCLGCHSSDARQSLIDAARRGDTPGVLKAIDNGANPNSHWGEDGTPALVFAVDSEKLDTVDALLSHGAKVEECITATGDTPLIQACYHGNLQVVDDLIHHGANVNVKDKSGLTPLITAVWQCHTEVVLSLLAAGADPNAHDNSGSTVLMYAQKQLRIAENSFKERKTTQLNEKVSNVRKIISSIKAQDSYTGG